MNIVSRRKELEMTQKELAEACNISQQLLCDIEKGRSKPSINTAIRLAKELQVENIDFFADYSK